MSYPGNKADYPDDFVRVWNNLCVEMESNDSGPSEEWIDIVGAWRMYQMGYREGFREGRIGAKD